jgi:hypothetical protein
MFLLINTKKNNIEKGADTNPAAIVTSFTAEAVDAMGVVHAAGASGRDVGSRPSRTGLASRP